MEAPPKRRGRPPKSTEGPKRGHLRIRIHDRTRAALEREAAVNSRSLSEEAEFRLELSVRAPAILDEALELAWGRQISGLVLILARAIEYTGGYVQFFEYGFNLRDTSVFDEPWAYHEAVRAADRIFEAFRPPGDIVAPRGLAGVIPPDAKTAEWLAELGRNLADDILSAVAFAKDDGSELQRWAKPLREKLGDEVVGRVGAYLQAYWDEKARIARLTPEERELEIQKIIEGVSRKSREREERYSQEAADAEAGRQGSRRKKASG